jgi:hypothetical protein
MTTAQVHPGDRIDAAELAEVPEWLDDLAATLARLADRHRGPSRAALTLQAERCQRRANITRAALAAQAAQAEAHAAELTHGQQLAAAIVGTIDERGNVSTLNRNQCDQFRDLRLLAQLATAPEPRPQAAGGCEHCPAGGGGCGVCQPAEARPLRYALQSSDGYEWNTEDAFAERDPETNRHDAFRAYSAFQRLMKEEKTGAAQVRGVATADPTLDLYDLPALPDARVSILWTWPAVPLADLADEEPDQEEPAGMIDHDDEDRRAAQEKKNARPRPSNY